MIIDITVPPGETLEYEQRRAIIDSVRAMGHKVHFINQTDMHTESGYAAKLGVYGGSDLAEGYLAGEL